MKLFDDAVLRASSSGPRRATCYALAGLFVVAGVEHFRNAPGFIAIVPATLPRPDLLVMISGMAELVLAGALLVRYLRPIAALLLVLLMLAVWPANWNMALHPQRWDFLSPLTLWARVLLQIPMVFWALYAGGLWPRNPVASPLMVQSESR